MWRELYPAGIHYLIGQILGSAVLLWLAGHVGNAQERYYSYTLVISGLTGVLVMFPAVYFYRKDRIGRLIGGLTSVEEQRLSIPEMLLLLAAGAGFAQYANVLVAILQNWISSSYGETMTKITSGKSLFMMIFWMGIIAPVATGKLKCCSPQNNQEPNDPQPETRDELDEEPIVIPAENIGINTEVCSCIHALFPALSKWIAV